MSYLCLGVGTGPGHLAIAPELRNLGVELVRKHDSEGHALFRLISGVAEHKSLVPSSDIVFVSVLVHTLGNVWTLLLQGDQNVASFEVETCSKIKIEMK